MHIDITTDYKEKQNENSDYPEISFFTYHAGENL